MNKKFLVVSCQTRDELFREEVIEAFYVTLTGAQAFFKGEDKELIAYFANPVSIKVIKE